MKKLELCDFSAVKPFAFQSAAYYILAKKDYPDLSKVRVARLFYPKEILESDVGEIPYISFEDSIEEVHSKDFLFGPEVTVNVNVFHLELLLEVINEDKLLMYNFDYEKLKKMYNLKKQGKDYHSVAEAGKSKCLYGIEESDVILVENDK